MRFQHMLWGLALLLPAFGWAAEPPVRLATLEYPPYIVQTEQGAQGLSVDIVKTAFARIGRSTQIEFYPIARGQHMLLAGEVDGFFSIKKTPEREKTMLFSQKPLISQDYVFFVRKHSHWRFNGQFASIAKANIGIVYATSYGSRFDSAVQSGQLTKLDSATDYAMTFRKLLAGRVDTVICSRLVGMAYLKAMGKLNEVEITGPPVETTFSYLAFTRQRDNTALAQQFDQAMDSMQRDGTLQRLLNTKLSAAIVPKLK